MSRPTGPTKLIDDRRHRQQLAETRGAPHHPSRSPRSGEDFAIIPALFVAFYTQLQVLNIRG